ncbi:MAG: hypothetical protein PHV17_07505 [Candidatus Omnitrophica bacterium]|nr:hypothetical protein [Candidatus Omnitrophota bacterium]
MKYKFGFNKSVTVYKTPIYPFFLNLFFVFSLSFIFVNQAADAFFVSVSPVTGSGSLQFGRIRDQVKGQEMRLRITDTGSNRYQVRQRFIEIPRNNRGEQIDSRAITFYTVNGSNSHGTLYQSSPGLIDNSDRVLYTSSSSGDNDSFLIVYEINPEYTVTPGDFFGRIQYIVRPLDGSSEEKRIITNFYFTVESDFSVEINTSSHSRAALSFKETGTDLKAWVEFNLTGEIKKDYSIFQHLSESLRTDDGVLLDAEAVQYLVSSEQGESFYPVFSAISRTKKRVYQSDKNLVNESVLIDYKVSPETTLKLSVGTYRGRISYDFEVKGMVVKTFSLPVSLEVKPKFSINVGSDEGGQLLFKNLKPQESTQQSVTITVESNQNRPFVVIQRISSPLSTNSGQTIDLSYLSVRVQKKTTSLLGTFDSSWQTVDSREMVVYSSDLSGAPVSFGLDYSLTLPRDAFPGDYYASINYSLIEK